MPTVSKKQEKFMQAVANNPKFAKKVDVPQSVGKEFIGAKEGGEMKESKAMMAKDRKNEWYEANREQVIQAAATRPLEVKRVYQKAWKERNTVWVRADTKARRRKHRLATPKWLTQAQKGQIRELYKIAITMTKTTGEQYVVDHIVPLRSEFVCGLHVPWNLRVIPRQENLLKSNKLIDTPPTT